jgi:hypothetical protein
MIKSYMKKAILFCTYCSAVKRRKRGLMPAIRRYLSPRIRAVYREGRRTGAAFAILSGQFGLIGPWKRIPYYDRLLESPEIPALLPQMVEYLRKKGFRSVRFYHDAVRTNPKIKPYLHAIALSCRRARMHLTMVEISAVVN